MWTPSPISNASWFRRRLRGGEVLRAHDEEGPEEASHAPPRRPRHALARERGKAGAHRQLRRGLRPLRPAARGRATSNSPLGPCSTARTSAARTSPWPRPWCRRWSPRWLPVRRRRRRRAPRRLHRQPVAPDPNLVRRPGRRRACAVLRRCCCSPPPMPPLASGAAAQSRRGRAAAQAPRTSPVPRACPTAPASTRWIIPWPLTSRPIASASSACRSA